MRPHCYIDATQAFKVAELPKDHWILPTYRRWFALGICVTVLLMVVAR